MKTSRWFVGCFVLLLGACSNPVLDSDFTTTAGEPDRVAVANVVRVDQLDANGCLPASAATMISTVTGTRVEVATLLARNGLDSSKGLTIDQTLVLLRNELPGHSVRSLAGGADTTVLRALHTSLLNGLPVLVFLACENPNQPGTWDFHASVVTAMDTHTKQATLANVYGYNMTCSYQQLVDRMSYRVGTWPFAQGVVLALGLQPKNAYLLVE